MVLQAAEKLSGKALYFWRTLQILFFLTAYGLPFLGLAVSLSVFLLLKRFLAMDWEGRLINVFAPASVAGYYWFRLPALIGFGLFRETVCSWIFRRCFRPGRHWLFSCRPPFSLHGGYYFGPRQNTAGRSGRRISGDGKGIEMQNA